MSYKVIFVFLLICSAPLVFQLQAQKEATRLLDRMEVEFTERERAAFDFTLTIEVPEQEDIEMKGHLKKSGEQYSATLGDRWFKSDGTSQWVYDPDLGEVQIYKVGQDDALPMNPDQLLSMYKDGDFEYDITREEMTDEGLLRFVEFKPTDTASEIIKVRIAIYDSSGHPQYFKVFERDGVKYTLALSSISTNPSFSNGEFSFDPERHPNLKVEDLRID